MGGTGRHSVGEDGTAQRKCGATGVYVVEDGEYGLPAVGTWKRRRFCRANPFSRDVGCESRVGPSSVDEYFRRARHQGSQS